MNKGSVKMKSSGDLEMDIIRLTPRLRLGCVTL